MGSSFSTNHHSNNNQTTQTEIQTQKHTSNSPNIDSSTSIPSSSSTSFWLSILKNYRTIFSSINIINKSKVSTTTTKTATEEEATSIQEEEQQEHQIEPEQDQLLPSLSKSKLKVSKKFKLRNPTQAQVVRTKQTQRAKQNQRMIFSKTTTDNKSDQKDDEQQQLKVQDKDLIKESSSEPNSLAPPKPPPSSHQHKKLRSSPSISSSLSLAPHVASSSLVKANPHHTSENSSVNSVSSIFPSILSCPSNMMACVGACNSHHPHHGYSIHQPYPLYSTNFHMAAKQYQEFEYLSRMHRQQIQYNNHSSHSIVLSTSSSSSSENAPETDQKKNMKQLQSSFKRRTRKSLARSCKKEYLAKDKTKSKTAVKQTVKSCMNVIFSQNQASPRNMTNKDPNKKEQLSSTLSQSQPELEPESPSSKPRVVMIQGTKVTIVDEIKKVFIIDLLPPETCSLIRQMAEDHTKHIELIEGKDTKRSWRTLYTYTKMDLPCGEVPNLSSRITDHIMADVKRVVGELYGKPNEAYKLRARSWKEPHLLKYQKVDGKDEHLGIEMHYDGCDITWQAMLSDQNEYTGGGTYFRCLRKTIRMKQGQVMVHPGELYHKGLDITSGYRYLVVCFMDGFDPKILDDSSQTEDKEEYEKNVCVY